MRARMLFVPLGLLLPLAACEGQPDSAEADSDEITLPDEGVADTQESEAEEAAAGITEDNADATLEELESEIGGESDQ